jgi:thymidylate synthase (FAD)
MNTAQIIAITKPLYNDMTAEQFIAYTARVSNPSNQMNNDTSNRLLKYCMKNNHWSIFETVSITMEINTTRDIARQILRHKSFSFQEFSQRYADPTQLGWTAREARLQDIKNRQNSIEMDYNDDSNENLIHTWELAQIQVMELALKNYNWAIENGIAKEQARALLPEGLTNSKLYMAGTLRSWIHYTELRMANGTQKEHREVATSAFNELCNHFTFLKE